MVGRSSAPSATSRSARAKTTFCKGLRLVQPVQGGPDPGPVLLRPRAASRRSARSAAARRPRRRAAPNVTDTGANSRAAGPAGRRAAHRPPRRPCRRAEPRRRRRRRRSRRDPVGDHRPGGPAQHEGRRRHVPVTGSRWLVIPARTTDAARTRSRTPPPTPRRTRTGEPSRSGCSTQRVTTAREKCPCPTNTTSRSTIWSKGVGDGLVGAHAHLVHALPAGAAVGPQQPARGLGADLVGGQALVVAVVPLGQQRGHLVDRQPGQLGGGQGALARAADHQRVVQAQVLEGVRGEFGLPAPDVGELQVGAAGVLAVPGPFGFAVRSRTSRWFPRLTSVDSAGSRGLPCQPGRRSPNL